MVIAAFFFFQAEDGIRDRNVTGVQTCALPILSPDGNEMAFVTEDRLWTVPMDGAGGATGPPRDITADHPESPRWEGDSQHLVYQTPLGLRRVPADGGPPDPIALDLRWAASVPPPRVLVHAGHLLDLTIEGLRPESDIVVEP